MRGTLGVLIFDDLGAVTDLFTAGHGAAIITRVGKRRWHTVLPISDTVIYHEMKPGPYAGPHETEYPSWAPGAHDTDAAAAYQRSLYALFSDATPR